MATYLINIMYIYIYIYIYIYMCIYIKDFYLNSSRSYKYKNLGFNK